MWLVRSWLIGLVAAISLLAQGASKAEPVKIRVSWIAPLSNWASLLMEKKEIARHMGRTYIFEPVRYAGTPQMITALANNELEIANLAFSTLPLAIHNAGLSDLRVIADEFQDGMQDYYSQEYMVLADGPVKRLEDVKGRVIAINAGGSAVDVAMRKMLLNAGLEQKRDYVMIEAPLPTMRAMLAEKKADLVPLVVPFSFDPELRPISEDAELAAQFQKWKTSRGQFNEDLKASGTEAQAQRWQKHYYRGVDVHGQSAPVEDHRTRIRLKPFAKKW
jgi:NitT/TauT family transport system substrate-binding protein